MSIILWYSNSPQVVGKTHRRGDWQQRAEGRAVSTAHTLPLSPIRGYYQCQKGKRRRGEDNGVESEDACICVRFIHVISGPSRRSPRWSRPRPRRRSRSPSPPPLLRRLQGPVQPHRPHQPKRGRRVVFVRAGAGQPGLPPSAATGGGGRASARRPRPGQASLILDIYRQRTHKRV